MFDLKITQDQQTQKAITNLHYNMCMKIQTTDVEITPAPL
jgi:hypothetical protein